MDIKKIRDLLNSEIPDDMQEYWLKRLIANDEEAIPDILQLLAIERQEKKEIIEEMNLQLSRADIGLDNPKVINKNGFIQNEIREFYAKYKDHIGHCFRKYTKEELILKKNEDFI